jgi:hypothetical protein
LFTKCEENPAGRWSPCYLGNTLQKNDYWQFSEAVVIQQSILSCAAYAA